MLVLFKKCSEEGLALITEFFEALTLERSTSEETSTEESFGLVEIVWTTELAQLLADHSIQLKNIIDESVSAGLSCGKKWTGVVKWFSCNTLPVPRCHAIRRKHEGWVTAQAQNSLSCRLKKTVGRICCPKHKINYCCPYFCSSFIMVFGTRAQLRRAK
ncbi:hypothetical protein T265_06625 [Opisthorchis viverrini]|uniref:Uncharacterized protein n=1 Tax=Opisthorchis viverrini TaxID=6198 RepID=A0A074ZFT1_OPIVI|nr:hypothetical protein T265_06625 [Opisthorchis viverrini]KER26048.1 hypothetical protein T265_06625 [Opisthorchis viverrini]